MKYRPAIDGLRAVAVLPVVLYHAGVPLFSGGFVGVDVFFVISGYLITSLIAEEIKHNQFSILKFYERRARRILPALFLVLVASSVIAYKYFLANDLFDYSKSLLATTAFVSNFYFFSDTGYFAAPAEVKPLLHTWSLAIEEQFYIVFPLLLLLVHKLFPGKLKTVVSSLGIASLLYSVFLVSTSPDFAFYSPLGRAWELLMGALLALGIIRSPRNRWLAESAAACGLIMICIAVVTFDRTTLFPGGSALLPCLGTFLVLWGTSRTDTQSAALLSLRPMVLIGLVSYSLYLWHWPVLVFAKYYLMRPLGPFEVVTFISISFLLSLLSWRYVETPFRGRSSPFSRSEIFRWSAFGMIALAAFGILGFQSSGFHYRHQHINMDVIEPNLANGCFDSNVRGTFRREAPCILGTKIDENPDFVLWGDSHANVLYPLFEKLAIDYGKSGVFFGKASCPPLVGLKGAGSDNACVDFNEHVLNYIEKFDIDNVFVAARWNLALGLPEYEQKFSDHEYFVQDGYTTQPSLDENLEVYKRTLSETLSRLEELKVNSWLVLQAPYPGIRVPHLMIIRRKFLENETVRIDMIEGLNRHEAIKEILEPILAENRITVIDPEITFCKGDSCLIAVGGHNLYRDDDHLSEKGALMMEPDFFSAFKELGKKRL